MNAVRTLRTCDRGATAAEFALVLPLLLILLLGMIDVAGFAYTVNRGEKATQLGARYAAVTDMVPQGLATHDFVNDGVSQGDPVPQSLFGGATCSSSGTVSCACKTGATCPSLGTANATAFNNIVQRIRRVLPQVTAANVVVEYNYSGLGYSGDPGGSDVAPLITVKLRNVTFSPLLTRLFGASLSLPDFRSSVTMEDGTGNLSN